jgi:hypothetical protein
MSSGSAASDYDYIIRIIQYLDQRHGIHFFINSRDFDVLYRWWEKRIPEPLIREALDRVVERCRRLKKPLGRFSVFSSEVRRDYRSFLSLDIGSQRSEPGDEHAEIRNFLAQFPPPLEFMKEDFAGLFAKVMRGEAHDPGPLQEKLLAHFREDNELNAKTAWFLKNIAPAMRKPDIERKYRLNYLAGRFAIPPLE